MHARSRDSWVISLIYVRVKVAHSWKLKAGFRACPLPQSSACWMWPPFWLDVWSAVRVCVYMRPGCFSACQQLMWYMAEAAFLPPSERQPAMHAWCEPDTVDTRRSWSASHSVSFAKIILATYWSSAASKRFKNKTKLWPDHSSLIVLTISENNLLFTKPLHLPYFSFICQRFFPLFNSTLI